MKCLCGSGKHAKNCHGSGLSKGKIRHLLKYDLFKIENRKAWINSYFRPLGFGRQTIKCTLKYWKTTTPADIIIYPLFLIKNNKAVRPITIDGLHYHNQNDTVTQYIQCMLTPLSRGTISFQTDDINFGKNGYVTVNCYLQCEGNPFESVFAIEANEDSIKLFHHTSKENAALIHKSSILKSSKWNLQGTQEIQHNEFNFIYFTDLETIQDIFDLSQIGMADKDTEIHLSTDDGNQVESLHVYRENKNNRDCTLSIWVDFEIISPPPLILHEPGNFSGLGYSWWEVFHGSIFRVPVKPESCLPLKHIRDKEYQLVADKNLVPITGFLAGHGMDMTSMKRILSEPAPDCHPRKDDPTNADIGYVDPQWIKTWNKNLSALSAEKFANEFNQKNE